jgi:hypothetical protein
MVEQFGELRPVFFCAGGFFFIDTFTARVSASRCKRVLFIGGDSGVAKQHLSKLIGKKEFCKIDSAMRFCNRFLLGLPLYRRRRRFFTNTPYRMNDKPQYILQLGAHDATGTARASRIFSA